MTGIAIAPLPDLGGPVHLSIQDLRVTDRSANRRQKRLEEDHTMRNLLDFFAASAVIVTLGAAPVAAKTSRTEASSPSPCSLVGHWVRDADGRIIGSISAIKGRDAVMQVGSTQGFLPRNRLINVPLSEVRQTADGIVLSSVGMAALGLQAVVG